MPYTIGAGPKYYEILDGVRYDKVSPKDRHASVQLTFGSIILALGRECGRIGTEWEFRVGDADGTDSILQPDISFVSTERLTALPKRERGIPPWSPDLAVEIRSPSSRPGLRAKKTARYLATGALLVLDVDPATRTIVAHSVDGIRAYQNADHFEHEALPWLAFDVAEVFANLDE